MLKYLIISLRIPHWLKNSFIFAAIIFSKHLFDIPYLVKTFAAFVLFSLISSAGYLINDIMDLPEDKKHPSKRNRPLAAGKLKLQTAIWTSILLIAVTLPCGLYLNRAFGQILIIYLILELIYSFFLKHRVILDVLSIASGFILRVIAGGVVIDVEISKWLLICTGLIALFLGLSKRRHDLRGYSPYLLDQMISVVTSSTLIAYTLYTISPETIQKFGTDKLILTIPFVLYGIFRYLYLIHQKEERRDPTRLLLTDLPCLIDIALWILTSVIIIYCN